MQSISLAIYDRIVSAKTTLADLPNRLERTDRGQTALEYVGLIILIAAIILALFQIGLVGEVEDAVQGFIDDVLGGEPD